MNKSLPQVKLDEPIFLLGMPRSGTTWLSQIFEMAPEVAVRLSPNYSYQFKNKLTTRSTASDWLEVLTLSLLTEDPFMTQNWKRERGELEWIEKDIKKISRLAVKDTRFHDVYLRAMNLFPKARCLYIVRHPCGQLNSWKSSPEFPLNADFQENWRTGACRKLDGIGEYWGFDDWKSLTLEYLSRERTESERFKVFRYETLVEKPVAVATELFRFVGLDLHEDVANFLVRSHAFHSCSAFSVFRSPSVADRWRMDFPEDITATIYAELRGTEAERFLG